MRHAHDILTAEIVRRYHDQTKAGLFQHNGKSFQAEWASLYGHHNMGRNFSPVVLSALVYLRDLGLDLTGNPEMDTAWDLIAAEMPRVPDDGDGRRVSYLRYPWHAAEYEGRGRWTVGRGGGYISRIFGSLIPSHKIDEILERAAPTALPIEWLEGEEMCRQMHPDRCLAHSCMIRHSWPGDVHPYEAYAPHLGWRMAVIRNREGMIECRALVNSETMTYTRIYAAARTAGGYLTDSAPMRAQLQAAGYSKDDNWEGRELAQVMYRGRLVGPYLDGDVRTARRNDSRGVLVVDSRGSLILDNTNGEVDGDAPMVEDIHGEMIPEDAAVWSDPLDGYIRERDSVICSFCQEHTLESETVRTIDHDWICHSHAVEVGGRFYREDDDRIEWRGDAPGNGYILAGSMDEEAEVSE